MCIVVVYYNVLLYLILSVRCLTRCAIQTSLAYIKHQLASVDLLIWSSMVHRRPGFFPGVGKLGVSGRKSPSGVGVGGAPVGSGAKLPKLMTGCENNE